MNNNGQSIFKTLKLPLTLAISSCLLVACSTTTKTTPSNTSTPVGNAQQSGWGQPNQTAATNESLLDDETLSILNNLLQARDMSMVQNDRIEVERYGNLWDRIRRGYRLSQPLGNQRIDAQKAWFGRNQDYLNRLTARASRYLHYTVTEAERRGIPTELALLPIIESSYDPSATSNASAAGLWQFIPSTGRIYGLSQSATYDGRRDVIESTRAAYDFLTSLYNQFGSWELALAAYNAGPGRIQRAIDANRAQGLPTDYWSLRLPTETMNYVPRFMAVTQVIGNPSHYGVSLPAIANHAHFRAVPVNTGVSLQDVSSISGVPIGELQLLNPALIASVVDLAGPSRVVIPDSVMNNVDAKLSQLRGYGSTSPTILNTAYIRPQTSAGNPNMESAQILRQKNTLPTTKASVTSENTIIQEPPLSTEERDFIANQIRQNSGGVEPVNVRDGNIQLRAIQTGQSVLEAQGKTKSLEFGKPVETGSTAFGNPNIPNVPMATNTQMSSIQNPNLQNSNQPAYTHQNTTSAPATQAMTHQVQRGDTLIGIAQRYGVGVQELRDWNQMGRGDYLVEGRVLRLYNAASQTPSRATQTTEPKQSTQTSEPRRTQTTTKQAESYTIKSGDTLIGVAAAHGLSVSQLASYNNLDTNARLLRGQKLWLVAGKVKPKATPTSNPAPATVKKTVKTANYKVQRGETLIGLADRLGISPSDIAQLNDFGANDNLIAGATIAIPASVASKATARPATTTRTKDSRYTIGSGDTLIGLADRFGVDVATLADANNLSTNARLVAGQTLVVPSDKATKSTRQTSEPQGRAISNTENHKVKSGETLTSLANRHGVSISDLAATNRLDTKARLQAGQTIKIPKATKTHTVRSGESLISLAKRYGVSASELAKMNGLSPNDSIKIGQKLTVPNR